MINFKKYEEEFTSRCTVIGYSNDIIFRCLEYAKCLNDNKVPIIFNITHLSNLLGYKRDYVVQAAVVSKFSEAYYRYYKIPKKNGSFREIKEPLPNLKNIQYWILDNILYNIPVSSFSKAYKKGMGLKHNLKFHKGQKVVCSLDIIDFFPSIKYKSINEIFLSLGYSTIVSKYLAKLVTLNERLPQGAPTSPYLSNIIMRKIDAKIGVYCKENNLRFTRYSDDITISGEKLNAKNIQFIKSVLQENGFELNEDKTKIMGSDEPQLVTGVLVNEKIQMPKDKRRKIRQELFFIKKFGFKTHCQNIGQNPQKHLNHLLGLISFGLYLNKEDKELKKYLEILKTERKIFLS